MSDFPSFFTQGVNNTLIFKNGGQFLYKGPWTTVFQNTELDRWFVGDFASATYNITVEVDSNKKETLQVLVVARPDQANFTIFGRVAIDDEIVDVSAVVNDSYLSFRLSAKIPQYEGCKVIYSVSYGGSINQLTPPVALNFLIDEDQPIPGSGGTGGGVDTGSNTVNLSSINSSLVPETDSFYNLGSPSARWNDLYLSGSTIYLGNTLISASGNTLQLPANTEIDNAPLFSYANINVTGQSIVSAKTVRDTLNIVAGDGIDIVSDPENDTITINNTGGGGSGGGGSSTTTTVVSNTPSFGSVSVAGNQAVLADRAGDQLNLVAGTNITITTDPTTDAITISASGGGGGGGGGGIGGTATEIVVNAVASSTYPIVMASGTNPISGQQLFANSQITIDNDNGVINATAARAVWADLAEKYQADQELPSGTVVMFGGVNEITISRGYKNTKIAGVVSTAPAFIMNSELKLQYTTTVALQGRVPCSVVGKIKKGDMLVTSNIPGVATSTDEPVLGSVIGKALENYDNIDEIGKIEVVVGRM